MQIPNRILYDPDRVFPDWTWEEKIGRSRSLILPFLLTALLVALLAGREAYYVYNDWRQSNLPAQEARDPWVRNTRYWMNPQEISRFYKMPLETVFSALGIQPVPGDENLTLRELAEKYNRSPDQVRDALNYLNNQQPRR
ncbi:MAG: hypothetical protein ABRQ23_08090 [Syntrophomonadaceae bacterium]